MSLSESTISIIKATAPVVAQHAREITGNFYPRMLAGNPEVLQYFNSANQGSGRQPQALADAVIGYALNIDNLGALGGPVARMAHKHVALQVPPKDYAVVHKHLMDAIGEVLGDAVTPEIGKAWSDSVLFLANVLIDTETKLYDQLEAAPGGWRGFRKFTVAARSDGGNPNSQMAHLRLEAEDGGKVMSAIPGNYATIRFAPNVLHPSGDVPHVAPRHYSVVSSDDSGIDLCIRRVKGGLYSNYIHDHVKVGDSIDVAPPCGAFTLEDGYSSGRSVFVAGGVGFTPLAHMAKEVKKSGGNAAVFHAVSDASDASFVKDLFGDVPVSAAVTTPGQGPNVADILAVAEGDKAADFYVCAPPPMIQAVHRDLVAEGVPSERIFYEAFGPHVAV